MPPRNSSQYPINHYAALIRYKAWADFKAEAERTYLGVIWWGLEPLINMAIYYMVFGVFLHRGGDDYIAFLLVGLIVWRFFDTTVTRASGSIFANIRMICQVAFNKIIYPIVSVATCCYEFVFSLFVLFGILLVLGYYPSATWMLFPVQLLLLVFITFSFAIPLAALVPFFPDLQRLIRYGLRIMFYMSGILYDIEELPEKAQSVLRYNPLISLVDSFRDILLYHQQPDWMHLVPIFLGACISLAIGLNLNQRLGLEYGKRVKQ